MVEFKPVSLADSRDFVLEMFLLRAWESLSDSERRSGLNRFKEAWLASPEADSWLTAVEASLTHEDTIADVVSVNGTSAGFVWATAERLPSGTSYFELRLVAFKLNFQRQGLGRLAAHHVAEMAAEHGATAVRSTGSATRESIRRYHASLGFEPVQTVFEKELG